MQWIKYPDTKPEEAYPRCYLVAGIPTCGGCGRNYQFQMCSYNNEKGFEFGEYDCGMDAKYWCKPEIPTE